MAQPPVQLPKAETRLLGFLVVTSRMRATIACCEIEVLRAGLIFVGRQHTI